MNDPMSEPNEQDLEEQANREMKAELVNPPKDMLRVNVCDGKYTVVQDCNGRTTALRYGEPWRECVGDNLILGMAYEIERLREQLKEIHKVLIELTKIIKL